MPPGFCITADGFKLFNQSCGVATVKAVLNARMPDDLQGAISRAYLALGQLNGSNNYGKGVMVAVRSSAIG